MDQNQIIELLLFLAELKAKKQFEEKYEWELNRNIESLKALLQKTETGKVMHKKDGMIVKVVLGAIEFLNKYFFSP